MTPDAEASAEHLPVVERDGRLLVRRTDDALAAADGPLHFDFRPGDQAGLGRPHATCTAFCRARAAAPLGRTGVVRVKAFVKWALPGGWPDPLARLHRVREKGAKKTRERRAATHEQLLALLTADLSEQLLLAYALAAYNWLRQNELEDLTWDRVHLDATIPLGGLPQKQGSDHTLDYVPLHPFAVRLLRGRIGLGSARVLRSVPDVRRCGKTWGGAAVAFLDDKWRRLDF